MRNRSWFFLARTLGMTAVMVMLRCSVWAYPGRVLVKDGELRWGQYRNLKGVMAVEDTVPPGAGPSTDTELWRLPGSGASAVLIDLQTEASSFFSETGEIQDREKGRELLERIRYINKFDMLPIIVLFAPASRSQLESREAYARAAIRLVDLLAEDVWYLLCVTERCGAPDWKADSLEMVKRVVQAIREKDPELVVAAGGSSAEVNESLIVDPAVDVLVGYTGTLRLGQGPLPLDQHPIIEVVDSAKIEKETLEKAVRKVGVVRIDDHFPYGFAVRTGKGSPLSENRAAFLEVLAETVDTVQKKVSRALPPSEESGNLLSETERKEGFVSLFNGRNLSGWVPLCKPDNFVVEDGTIRTDRMKGGWLRSWRSYQDFIFRAEYWIEDGGNSGLFIRAPLVGRESRIGFEFQIIGEDSRTQPDKRSGGSLYDVRAADGNYLRPGQWNEVEIQCIGSEVTVRWNGRIAHHFRYEEIDFMKGRSREGYIGLQDHYNRVRFRNLRIKEIR